eukprot:1200547-Rhodomonas_salina.4
MAVVTCSPQTVRQQKLACHHRYPCPPQHQRAEESGSCSAAESGVEIDVSWVKDHCGVHVTGERRARWLTMQRASICGSPSINPSPPHPPSQPCLFPSHPDILFSRASMKAVVRTTSTCLLAALFFYRICRLIRYEISGTDAGYGTGPNTQKQICLTKKGRNGGRERESNCSGSISLKQAKSHGFGALRLTQELRSQVCRVRPRNHREER